MAKSLTEHKAYAALFARFRSRRFWSPTRVLAVPCTDFPGSRPRPTLPAFLRIRFDGTSTGPRALLGLPHCLFFHKRGNRKFVPRKTKRESFSAFQVGKDKKHLSLASVASGGFVGAGRCGIPRDEGCLVLKKSFVSCSGIGRVGLLH